MGLALTAAGVALLRKFTYLQLLHADCTGIKRIIVFPQAIAPCA